MTDIASLPVILGAAALLAALPALAAAFLAWRAAERQAALGGELGARLRDLRERLDGARGQRSDAAGADLAALRDDLAILFEHVSALTSGQLDVKKIVGSTVARHVAAVTDRLEQTEHRADERAARLHDRIALVQERLTDLADDLAALKAGADHTERPAQRTEPAAADAELPPPGWHREEAGAPPPAPLPDYAPARAVAADRASEGPVVTAPPRRAPAVFDSGRVAMLMPSRRGAAG